MYRLTNKASFCDAASLARQLSRRRLVAGIDRLNCEVPHQTNRVPD